MSDALNKPKPRKKKTLLIAVCVIVGLLAVTAITFTATPVPAALLIRKLFETPNISPPEGYTDMQSAVKIYADIVYPSENGSNTLDFYLPDSEAAVLRPVILWVHGGAYVGGDKSDVQHYCTALASEGYAVISMNYARAPEARFPVPINQIKEVYDWLAAVQGQYSLDLAHIFFAGDSAGAHSVATFTLIQTNPDYARELGIAASVPKEHIKGVLLYCGPFDVQAIGEVRGIFGFFIKRAGWAYFGTKNWAEEFAEIASISPHLTVDYPPVFVTDGNANSFEPQGMDFVAALEAIGVPVTSYFIPLETEASHEYQFLMDSPMGVECYKLTVQFLQEFNN